MREALASAALAKSVSSSLLTSDKGIFHLIQQVSCTDHIDSDICKWRALIGGGRGKMLQAYRPPAAEVSAASSAVKGPILSSYSLHTFQGSGLQHTPQQLIAAYRVSLSLSLVSERNSVTMARFLPLVGPGKSRNTGAINALSVAISKIVVLCFAVLSFQVVYVTEWPTLSPGRLVRCLGWSNIPRIYDTYRIVHVTSQKLLTSSSLVSAATRCMPGRRCKLVHNARSDHRTRDPRDIVEDAALRAVLKED
ncbi:hypothetical protein AXG93_203s1130 [Marchantia polymorpha subsp. ruderalis]|uniref:Uncharacterized protein n=1 Tax=Marchantia polymorpha subsp. ruderalis TaxID=1480154 RepID=A0A176VIL2_MARPO|nr:hypothetical protein AXG93_203s1130 [Marchantia polymorpha subsp. ruderalis]